MASLAHRTPSAYNQSTAWKVQPMSIRSGGPDRGREACRGGQVEAVQGPPGQGLNTVPPAECIQGGRGLAARMYTVRWVFGMVPQGKLSAKEAAFATPHPPPSLPGPGNVWFSPAISTTAPRNFQLSMKCVAKARSIFQGGFAQL